MHLVDHARDHIEDDLSPPARRPADACAAGECAAASRPLPPRALAGGDAGAALRRPVRGRGRLEAARHHAEARPGAPRDPLGGRGRAALRANRPAPRPRRHARRLRPAGAAPGNRRSRHPPADPHGCRGAASARRGCCGSLTHHMGKEDHALANARANVDAWSREIEGEGLDAIIITTSGCGTTIKDYGHMLRLDPAYAERAARVSALAKDISEFLVERGLPAPVIAGGRRVAYHAACSLQHGQKVRTAPKALLKRGGLHRAGAGGRASVLRLGRHLQHPPAGDRREAARRARWRTSSAPRPRSSPPAISAASPRSPAERLSPSCIPSNCWIGRPVGRSRILCRKPARSPPDPPELPQCRFLACSSCRSAAPSP